MVAQIAVLDHPDAFFSAVTFVERGLWLRARSTMTCLTMTRRRWTGCVSRSMPDWSDRAAVAEFAAEARRSSATTSPPRARFAERKWDRTPGTEPAVQMANQLGMVFAKLDCTPRWRERLSELAIPALVVHGRRDPFFPVGNGEALTREIPGARLLVLERAATAIPDAAADEVAAAMLAL